MINLADKLLAVERAIVDLRWVRNNPDAPEHATYQALKAIAADLRGRMDGAPGVAEHELGRRVNAVMVHGSSSPRMNALAMEVLARWPVIKQALERFGATAEAER